MGYSIDPEAVLNKKITIGTYELDEIKSILFAISIGFSENPTDRSD